MKELTYKMFFSRVVPPRLYHMQKPEKVLVSMCEDLPEDFGKMRDCQESYNRPIMMERNEMGVYSVESEKKRKRGPTGALSSVGRVQPGSKGAELLRLGAETITSGGSAGTADPPGTGL
jgi:hypothetical protein